MILISVCPCEAATLPILAHSWLEVLVSSNPPEGVLSMGECRCCCRRRVLSLARGGPGGARLSFGDVQPLRLGRQSWPELILHLGARAA